MQGRQGASTISSSTTPGFWLTFLDMGECSSFRLVPYQLREFLRGKCVNGLLEAWFVNAAT